MVSEKSILPLSSSSCRTASTDLPWPFLATREVYQATFCIGTELLYIGSTWSSYLCSSMRRGLQEYIAYEIVHKLQFFPNSGRVDTAIWMHPMDANKAYGEKAWRQLHKNAASYINKSWRQHPTKQQLYGHLPPNTKTIQVTRTKHAGHRWRSNNQLILR